MNNKQKEVALTEMTKRAEIAESIARDVDATERALRSQLATAQARIATLEQDLKWISEAGQRENQLLRENGFKFETRLDKPDAERTPAEMWEKLAFSIHTDIWEIAQRAKQALAAGEKL